MIFSSTLKHLKRLEIGIQKRKRLIINFSAVIKFKKRISMKSITPKQPAHLSMYAKVCLEALVDAGLAKLISLGGAFGLFHYHDYRPTHDVDAWWNEDVTEAKKQEVVQVLHSTLERFGSVRVRAWGDLTSIELSQDGKTVFSFQIAFRSLRLEDLNAAGWIDVPLDSFEDLVSTKMNALVQRGAPRDFKDIYTICVADLITIEECWQLWHKRQELLGNEHDDPKARLAIESHLKRIALQRPLDQFKDDEERAYAKNVREWFVNSFLKVNNGK